MWFKEWGHSMSYSNAKKVMFLNLLFQTYELLKS